MTPLFIAKGSLLRAIRVTEQKLERARTEFSNADVIKLETDYNYMINCFNYHYGHRDRRFYKRGRG